MPPSLASCSGGGLKHEEFLEGRGASTRLRLVDVGPKKGRPLRLTLELHNGGPAPVLYDDQGIGLGSFEEGGAGGKGVPYIGWWSSTFGSDRELAPGETAVLLKAGDIFTDDLIEAPGRYRLSFGGGGLYFNKPGEDWPGFFPILIGVRLAGVHDRGREAGGGGGGGPSASADPAGRVAHREGFH